MKYLITCLILLHITVQGSAQVSKLPVEYDSKTGLFKYDEDKNKTFWASGKTKFKFDVKIPARLQYRYEPKIISAEPVSYKLIVPHALSPYFALADTDQQPIQRGPSVIVPNRSNIEDQIIISSEAITSIDNHLIAEYKLKGLTAAAGNIMVDANNSFTRDEMEELLIKGRKYDSLNRVLEHHLMEKNAYELLIPLTERFNNTYLDIHLLDSLSTKGLAELTKTTNKPDWQKVVDELKYEIGEVLRTDVEESWSTLVNRKFDELSGLNESIEELIATDILLNDELIQSIASINIAFEYSKRYKSERVLKLLNSLRDPVSSVSSKSLYYLKKMDATRLKLALVNRYSGETVHAQTIDIPVFRGVDLEFSTGFIYNSLYQRTFYLEDEEMTNSEGELDTMKVVKEQGVIRGDIAFSAFFHVSKRAASSRYGLSLGLGLSLIDAKPRYMIGGHSLFLKDQSIGITGGLVAANITQLGEQVSKDGLEPLETIPQDIDAVPTINKFRLGWYAGIVWNFARK